MRNFKISIVEDDAQFGKMLSKYLSLNPDNEVELYSNGKDFLKDLYKNPSVILLDYNLPDFNGDEILKKIKQSNANIPVIIISGQNDIETAISLLKEGAYDYIMKKPETKEHVWKILINIKNKQELEHKIVQLESEVKKKYAFSESIYGESIAIKNVFQLVDKAIKTNINVSITGETGTGKELIARAIHFNSNRAKQAFIAVNVSAIPSQLIESEMFGYNKGAFTGANSNKLGKFEEANEGTLFLDEIADMDLNMQTKLLRVLQEQEVTRLGSNIPIKINTRIIIATHKNLEDEVAKGNFREDLYYRIIGLPIEVPTLRNRENDESNKMKVPQISPSAIEKLMNYNFPGNVRELKSMVELACVMSDGGIITAENINFRTKNNLSTIFQKEQSLQEYTNQIVFHYLEKHNNDVKKVAEKLKIGISTMYKMLKEKK